MDRIYTVEELLSDQTFADYCQNIASVHREMWMKTIASNPEQEETFREARALLAVLSPSLPENEIQAEVNKIREVLSSRENGYVQPSATQKNKTKLVLGYSIIAIAFISIGTYFLAGKTETRGPIASAFDTKMGERKQYILPDGSTIILNSNSTFNFEKSFGKKDRRIYLNGDAFFKVAKDPSKPFVVITDGFSTTAVGTAFYVHGNASLENYGVDLLEGKVKLEKNKSGETLFLTPGEKATWTKTSSKIVTQKYDTITLNKWVNGILSFKNISVQDAFSQIEKWYSVEIIDRRSTHEDITINGDYINAPLEDVVKIICFSLACNYHFENDKIIIQ